MADANDREKTINTINAFLKDYPKTLAPAPNAPWIDLPVRDLVRKSIETMVDIINDIATIVSQKDQYSSTEYRRQMVNVFFQPSRRLYVGFWLIFASFILYFIDSAA
jgi:hypothetical protein